MLFIRSIFLLLVFLPCFCFAQFVDSSDERYKAYFYENGIMSSEGFLKNGKPNGYWITYYPNQLRKSEGNRKKFLLDSLWKFYDKKGNIENTIYYKEGRKYGLYSYYDDNCLLIKEESYRNDTIHGSTFEYYSDTAKTKKQKKVIPFVEGRKQGIGYEYGKDGRIITIYTYKKGFLIATEKVNRKDENGRKQGVWKTYFPNKRLKIEERYKNDLLNGYVKIYNAEGKLKSARLFIEGIEQDQENNIADFNIENQYFDNGKVKKTITYNLGGKKDGVSNTFDKNGNVIETEFYKNGYLLRKGIIDKSGLYQGVWETYYLNGKLKSKGEYRNGNKYGKWSYYFSSGKLEQEGFYDESGLFTNEWKWYYEDGSLLRKEEFRRGIEDGYFVEYNKEGEVITEGEYFDGEKEGEWIYKLNDHKEEGKFRYGQRNGLWEFRYPNGKLSFEGSFVEGNPEGEHKYFNSEGYLIREENYSYGKKDGKWKWYDSFGVEIMSITYKDGEEKKINGQKVKFSDK